MRTKIAKIREWIVYIVTPNVYPKRWQDRLFRGHANIGPITVFGANAMHWAVNVRFRGTYWCFHPRTRTFGGSWPAYFYISPNATPWAATFRGWRRVRTFDEALKEARQ